MENKMRRKFCRTKLKSQMLITETFEKTKKFFHKNLRNLKSFILKEYQKLPRTPFINPNFSGSKMINPKFQKLDNIYRSLSQQWDSNEVVNEKEGFLPPKVQIEADEQCSKSTVSFADYSGLEDLKEEKKANKYSKGKREESSFMAADALAQKMKELEMMDVNDVDHVQDIEEVLHYYSQLTCPAYQEMVGNFFMDMYSEFNLPQPSRSLNNSMRKLGSATVNSSMRSLGPIKI